MNLFVSRESELDQLSRLLREGLSGARSVAFVTGEAGSGKTALLTEFANRTQAADPEVVFAVGDCNAQTGIGDPYLPFREVLGQLTGDVEEKLGDGRISRENASRLSRMLEASGQALVDHAPDLVDILIPGGAILTRLGKRAVEQLPWARRLREISAGRLARGPESVGLEQSHVFEQCTRLLRALSGERPIVLILDDLHWIDPASAALLFHLARRLEDEPVLVLGAYRAGDLALGRGGERHPLEPVLAELKRYHGNVLVRVGESETDGRQFVDALVSAQAPGLEEEFRAELFRHTGGHPLFTVELLTHLKRTCLAVDGAGCWGMDGLLDWDALPARVEGLIEERAQRLDRAQRELLAVAAVEGEEFAAEVVAGALQREPREVIRELSGPLEKEHGLVRALGFRRVDGRRLAVYRFRHNLFQTWFYRTLDPVERSYLHEELGRTLESIHAKEPGEVAVRLARHFVEADDAAAALRYLLMAGDRARAAFANEDAARRYSEADLLVDQAADQLEEGLVRNARARIAEARGDLAELAARHDEAAEAYRKAITLVDPGAEPIRLARLRRKQAKPLEIQRRLDEALARLDEAEAALGEPPGEAPAQERDSAAVADSRPGAAWWDEWLEIMIERIWVNYWRGEMESIEVALERARPVLERWGASRHRARFHGCEALFGFRSERFHPSDRTLAAAYANLEASRMGAIQAELGMAHFQVGFAHMWRLELDRAERRLEEALGIAESLGDTTLLTRVLVYLGLTHRLSGDVERTDAILDRTAEVAEAADLREYVGIVHAQRAWVALRRGREDEARGAVRAALEEWDAMPFPYPMRTFALLPLLAWEVDAGNTSATVEIARRLLEPPHIRLREPAWSALEAVVEADDTTAAEVALGRALAAARELNYV